MSAKTIWTIALNILAIWVALQVARRTGTIISWILIALFIALALDPVVRWLKRRGMKRGIAVLVTYLSLAGLVALLVVTFIPLVVEQIHGLITSAPELLEKLKAHPTVQWADQRFNVVERAQRELRLRAPGLAMPVLGFIANILEWSAAIVTITILSIFFLLFGGRVFASALEWIEPARRARIVLLTNRMHRKVGGYVAGTLLISLIGGTVTTVGTLLLGVPYFLPLGLAMVLLGVIPWVGSALGAVLVVSATFVTVGTRQAVIALLAYLVYQQLEGHLLQPLVQRNTIKMNPLIIMIVMLFGTALAGILGTLIALPIAGAAQVVLSDILERRKAMWAARSGGGELILPAQRPEPEEHAPH